MRCNPLRWLWGLIPIAMLSWIAFNWERGYIETDLARRTQEALGKSGLSWANSKFSGRDAVLRGLAADEGDPKRAVETAHGVWGVRIVDSKTDLIKRVEKYSWLATLGDGRISLSGYVPSEDARKSVLGAARTNFPKLAIDDTMQLARGAPAQDIWLSGINFGMRQLTGLSSGKIDLNDVALSVAGEAADAAAYKALNAALGGKLPAGIRLAANNVIPPAVKVFTWSASLAENKLTMSGHVPSERAREDLFALAKKRFASMAIVDRLQIASGAPDGWPKAAAAVLEQLALLEDGDASTKASQLTISGTAKDQAAAEGIRKSLRSQVPSSFKTIDKIEYREVIVPPVDYDARWHEAESRWIDLEAARPRPVEPVEEGLPWWKEAQQHLASKMESGSANGGVNLNLEFNWGTEEAAKSAPPAIAEDRWSSWAEYEARWANIAADHDRRQAEAAERERAWREREERWTELASEHARRKADEDARRLAWLDAEERWAEQNSAYQRRRTAEEADRQAALVKSERKVEADRCQLLIGDAVKKGKILFKIGSAELDKKSTPTLNKLASIATACPKASIEISGHTDSTGDAGGNLALSERRAQSIVSFLGKNGIETGRLSAKGYGQTRPVAPNDTAQNKSKNRRIEFAVVPN